MKSSRRALRRNSVLAYLFAVLLSGPHRPARAADPAPPKDLGLFPSRYVNRELPRWVRLSGEFRTRVEGHTGIGFQKGADESYVLTRLRVNLDLRPRTWMHAFIQAQDARVAGIELPRGNTGLKDTFDLRLAYVELASSEDSWLRLQVGRQELDLGSTRLIGTGDWSNISRTFDAARLGLGRDGKRFSLFSASVINVDPTHFNTWQPGQHFSGVYGSLANPVPLATAEVYILWKTLPHVASETGTVRDADVFTAGGRWAGQLPKNFDYATEMALQAGHSSTDRIRAWAGYWIGGYTPPQVPLRPHITLKYGYASGDAQRGDGRLGTFDQLYSYVRELNGISEVVGWRNIRSLRAGLELKTRDRLKVTLNLHSFHLASPLDGLYNSRGVLVVAPPAHGAVHRDIGIESEAFLTYALARQISLGAGYAHFFPGKFLKENSPGFANSYPYLSFTYRF